MKRKRREQDPWEGYEFIDINSRSQEEPPISVSSRRRSSRRGSRPSSRPRREPPARERQPRPPGSSRRRPPSKGAQERTRKPMSKGARRFLLVFTLLCMAAVTAFLCVFLLFKVRVIQVTGDMIYQEQDVLNAAGYQEGDNLALLTTSEQEQRLEQQLPYIQDAQIIRHFPSTLEIRVTAAQVAADVQNGSQWYAVSTQGKILEEKTSPSEGVMQVAGLTLTDPVVGGQIQLEDESAQSALETIFSVLEQWGAAGDFTSLDLTDLYNITMNYQNRVQFLLGSTVELAYKVDYGLRIVTGTEKQVYIASDESGTLDLSLAGDTKGAYFTESVAGSSGASSSQGDSSSGGDSSEASDAGSSGGDSSSTGEDTSSGEDSGSSSQEGGGRGGDIPDTIFTG